MKRLLRWIGVALGSVAGLGIVAYAVVYVLSERVLRHTYAIPTVAISIPTDPASIIEGRRLATIHGCFGGCHGRQAEGAVMFDEPMIARFVAPNLTAAVRKYSDAELAVIIRNGVRPDGRSMFVMPSEVFVVLTDEDLSRIIAFLKSLPAVEGPGPSVSLGPARARRPRRWKVQAGRPADRRNRPASRRNERTGRLRTVSCADHLRPVPRDGSARRLPIPLSPVRLYRWWLPIPRKSSPSCCERAFRSGKGSLSRWARGHVTICRISRMPRLPPCTAICMRCPRLLTTECQQASSRLRQPANVRQCALEAATHAENVPPSGWPDRACRSVRIGCPLRCAMASAPQPQTRRSHSERTAC